MRSTSCSMKSVLEQFVEYQFSRIIGTPLIKICHGRLLQMKRKQQRTTHIKMIGT